MHIPRSLRNELKDDLDVLSAFWLHLLVYFLVMVTSWFFWIANGGAFTVEAWPVVPSIGWGFILVIHCLVVYRTFRIKKTKYIS